MEVCDSIPLTKWYTKRYEMKMKSIALSVNIRAQMYLSNVLNINSKSGVLFVYMHKILEYEKISLV